MLIAIMGDTFGERKSMAEQIKIKDHLAFVIDNWYLKEYSLGDLERINYIIAAYHVKSNSEENEKLQMLEELLREVLVKLK